MLNRWEMVSYSWHREMTAALLDHEGVLIDELDRLRPVVEAARALASYGFEMTEECWPAVDALRTTLADLDGER